MARGSVLAETAIGELEIGIPDGTAAWLDVHTQFGHVRNELDAADAPAPPATRPSRCAPTPRFGDITIRRSARTPTTGEDR